MAVSKYAVAGGIAAAAVGVGVLYCRQDFAEAAASGDFDRAERRAGLLAINDIAPVTASLTTAMALPILCLAWFLITRQ